ncbi:hypothetical protein HYU22_01810 [Candidatus Woesearchaeota archaeon]|nr:hypothetical protein [Candidatus Woesearchaeota archaeon]
MNENLEQLNQWISFKYSDYLSMIAVGSIAVGDTWIERRSDHDILLVFESYPERLASELREHLQNYDFDDSYLFTPLPKEEFIGPLNHSYDFSHKFRSKTLYGVDLISEVKLPLKEVTRALYENGLERVTRRMEHRLANASFWSDAKVRDVFWRLFKHSFMNLAIKAYANSGSYPQRRKDVVEYYAAAELHGALETLNTINNLPKEAIISAADKLIGYLRKH